VPTSPDPTANAPAIPRRAFIKACPLAVTALVAACDRDDPTGPRPRPPEARPRGRPFLFGTGIENSYPRLPDGRRVDEMAKTGHYERWREDFALVRELGIPALRYGPAYYRTNPAPGRYDWSSADDQMAWLRTSGVTVIADLCHFGVPDWMSGFNDPAFPRQFAAYARAFARRYPFVHHFTPINEMYIAAKFSAMFGWWNEGLTGKEAFAATLRNICLAHELAVEAIVAERPDALILQAESFERYAPADDSAASAEQAQFWNEARFATLDLTFGRRPSPTVAALLAAGGMTPGDFAFFRERRAVRNRRLGMDYYVTGEQVIDASGAATPALQRVGLAALGRTYYDRYGVPLWVTETNRVADLAVEWLEEQWAEVGSLERSGVPVLGFTWFPLTDVVDWRHNLRLDRGDVDPIGLCDLDRNVRPVGTAYAALIAEVARSPREGPLASLGRLAPLGLA
jgi:beta-glucosidase/6-phospho-beta-glucosidase/beta-galactosidase